ncbi:MAG: ABC transporter ATP-binding protein [Anaerolineae bacterium]|jgi:peptide/nickel transport system ATP-binding protein|nr:ABC transporter ATP-binding protein [Anaerolineae bacterium]
MTSTRPLLLEVEDLRTYFQLEGGLVRAVDGASLRMYAGETLGVVGESGCGKSVMALSILGVVPTPGKIVGGRIRFYPDAGDGELIDLTALDPKGDRMRGIRGLDITMIFQEPTSALSPVYTIGQQIVEALRLHRDLSRPQAREQVIEMLGKVGLPDPERTIDRYPHQLSGGMCQRAMIAMALCSFPDLLIADEPTTALDVTTEAQILHLMRSLQQEFGMAIMFITHNLGVIAQMAQRVVVMYLGEVVEEARVYDIFYHPLHPYAQALLDSVPRLGGRIRRRRLTEIRGSVPNVYTVPSGCRFHPRCIHMRPGVCDTERPPWLTPDPEHSVRCVLYR